MIGAAGLERKRLGGVRLGEGRRTDGRGLLLMVDAETDAKRIEVGRRLEGSFTDGFVGWVMRGNTRTFAPADAT